MHALREGIAYVLCVGGHSLAPPSDAGSHRSLGALPRANAIRRVPTALLVGIP